MLHCFVIIKIILGVNNNKWIKKRGKQRTKGGDTKEPSISESISLMQPRESSTLADTV